MGTVRRCRLGALGKLFATGAAPRSRCAAPHRVSCRTLDTPNASHATRQPSPSGGSDQREPRYHRLTGQPATLSGSPNNNDNGRRHARSAVYRCPEAAATTRARPGRRRNGAGACSCRRRRRRDSTTKATTTTTTTRATINDDEIKRNNTTTSSKTTILRTSYRRRHRHRGITARTSSSTTTTAAAAAAAARAGPARCPAAGAVRVDGQAHARQDQPRQLCQLLPDGGGAGAGHARVCAAADGGAVGRVVAGAFFFFFLFMYIYIYIYIVLLTEKQNTTTERIRNHPPEPLRGRPPERARGARGRRRAAAGRVRRRIAARRVRPLPLPSPPAPLF